MTGDGEVLEAEFFHQRDLVARHGALGIGLVVGAGVGFAAATVAAQVRTNHREVLRQTRRHFGPHGMGLRETVQQQQWWTGTAAAQADGNFVGLYDLELESIEHGTLVSESRSPGSAVR